MAGDPRIDRIVGEQRDVEFLAAVIGDQREAQQVAAETIIFGVQKITHHATLDERAQWFQSLRPMWQRTGGE